MAVGTIETSILTDIANAIRYQAGVATTYKPREMAAAVAALDGTQGSSYVPQPYMTLESGVLSESVFSDIAAAIRGQNGLTTLYQPGDMAQAILDLEWDVGYKVRALLLTDGTFEINTDPNGTQTFTVDATGFSPNEEVTVSLVGKDDPSITYNIGKVTADATGKVHGTLPAPTGVADGQYLLTLEGARYGEAATSKRVITVKNGAFDLGEAADNGIGGNGNGNATGAPTTPSNSAKAPANTGATQAASTSNKPLAKTGANGLLFGGIAAALVAIGGGVLIVRRRKA